MKNYFNKHKNNSIVYFLAMFICAGIAYILFNYGRSGGIILIPFLATAFFAIKGICHFTSYASKTVDWKDIESFAAELDQILVFKTIRPEEEGLKHYDIHCTIDGKPVVLADVPDFYKKEIQRISAGSKYNYFLIGEKDGEIKIK